MDTELLRGGGRILCAVSGGADSVYLLLRLAEMGYDVCAAHYHHGLRGAEADRDEAFVRALCQTRGIAFLSERGDTAAFAARERLGIEQAARLLRYDFLERAADELGCGLIATAHTADDNAETVLLHLARGAGLRGLGGIPPRRGRIVRPMLDVTRDEVLAYLRAQGVEHREDATNAGDDYARNRVRHGAMPALETVNPAFTAAVGRTAALLREDERFLAGLARDFVTRHSDGRSVDAPALTAAPWPVASRAVRLLARRELAEKHVRAILAAAQNGGMADVPGLRVARAGDRLYFDAAPARPIRDRALAVPGETALPEAGWTVRAEKFTSYPHVVHKSYNIFFFQCENICGRITVTGRRAGDSFRPAGRGCTKKLKQLFLERRVPPWERDGLPVLRDEAGILAVCGIGAAERACARPGDREIIQIEFIRAEPDEEGKGLCTVI